MAKSEPATVKTVGRIEYKVKKGKHLYVRPGGVASSHAIELIVGTLIIFDWLYFLYGPVAYEPEFDDSRMVPYGSPLPELTEEDIEEGYKGLLIINRIAG
jgi:hypothetical protein